VDDGNVVPRQELLQQQAGVGPPTGRSEFRLVSAHTHLLSVNFLAAVELLWMTDPQL
jgi:hypothetical protein